MPFFFNWWNSWNLLNFLFIEKQLYLTPFINLHRFLADLQLNSFIFSLFVTLRNVIHYVYFQYLFSSMYSFRSMWEQRHQQQPPCLLLQQPTLPKIEIFFLLAILSDWGRNYRHPATAHIIFIFLFHLYLNSSVQMTSLTVYLIYWWIFLQNIKSLDK